MYRRYRDRYREYRRRPRRNRNTGYRRRSIMMRLGVQIAVLLVAALIIYIILQSGGR